MTWAGRLDWFNKVDFVAIGSPKADRYLGELDVETQWGSSHFVGPDGQVLSAGESALALFSKLPLTAPFVWIYRLLPGHMVMVERLYKYVADNRFRFSPDSTCGMERPEALNEE